MGYVDITVDFKEIKKVIKDLTLEEAFELASEIAREHGIAILEDIVQDY